MSDQTLLKVTDLQRHFPFREVQGLRMVRGDGQGRRRHQLQRQRRARPSASSGSPAAASRRPRGW